VMERIGRALSSAPVAGFTAVTRRFARATLLLLPALVLGQGVELRGTVVAARVLTPLPNVEVAIPALGLSTRSDSVGAFMLTGVTAGSHRVTARRLGYNAVETDVRVGTAAPPPLRLILLSMQRLDSVQVIAMPLDNALLVFEENRRLGFGKFLTREQLVRYDGMKLASVMPQMSGVALVRAGQWSMLTSKRQSVGGPCGNPRDGSIPGSPRYTPDVYQANRGVPCACYAQVYIDGMLQNPGTPTEPFDVNAVPVDDIEGVEWYAAPSQTPVQYTRLNSACGVLVIHTRRAGGRSVRPPAPRPDTATASTPLDSSG
jgi:hypothetical protein